MIRQRTIFWRDPGVCAVQTTLRALLAVVELRLRSVAVDAESLSRTVRWAHTTELLNPRPYLRGQELVCTVGASLTDAESCQSFTTAVIDAGAAGICFGVGDIHDDVPQDLAQACCGRLPLIAAPLGVPFLAIAEYLADRRVDAGLDENRRAQQIVAQLLTGVRAQAPLSALLQILCRSLGGRVELTLDGQVFAAGEDATGPVLLVTADVGSGGTLTWSGTEPAPTPPLLEKFGPVLELARHERDAEQALKRERVGQLLLLVGDRLANPLALRPMLAETGLTESSLVLSAWPASAAPLLALHLQDSLIGVTPGIALALTERQDRVVAVAQILTLPCGYSHQAELGSLARATAEARAALGLARRRGGAVGPGALTSLEGLLEQQPMDRLLPFIDQLISPLLAADSQHGTNQVQTLRTFLRLDGSLQATARSQFLHVNTVRHRLDRIHHVIGHDPLLFADRTALAIALWAFDRRQALRDG